MILNSNHYSGVPGRRILMSYVSLQSTHAHKKICMFQLLLHDQISLANGQRYMSTNGLVVILSEGM